MTTNGQHSSADNGAVIEGTVEAINATGIKVRGRWASVSKFKPVVLPDVGVRVRLGLDAKGFITMLEVLEDYDPKTSSDRSPRPRDRTISRLAVLNAAAAFGASRPDLKSADVLKIADSWMAWIEAES